MFGLMLKSTHDTIVAGKDAEIAEAFKEVAKTGLLLTAAKRDREALKVRLQPFLDRQEKAKRNLRQFRHLPSNGVTSDGIPWAPRTDLPASVKGEGL